MSVFAFEHKAQNERQISRNLQLMMTLTFNLRASNVASVTTSDSSFWPPKPRKIGGKLCHPEIVPVKPRFKH